MLPCRGAHKNQHGENLKSADKHGGGEQQLDWVGEKGVVIQGANGVKTGADIGYAGKSGGEAASEAVPVKRNKEADADKDKDIAYEKAVHGPEGAALQALAVQLDAAHMAGGSHLVNLLAQTLEQDDNARDFDSAAGAAGAGAAEHQ